MFWRRQLPLSRRIGGGAIGGESPPLTAWALIPLLNLNCLRRLSRDFQPLAVGVIPFPVCLVNSRHLRPDWREVLRAGNVGLPDLHVAWMGFGDTDNGVATGRHIAVSGARHFVERTRYGATACDGRLPLVSDSAVGAGYGRPRPGLGDPRGTGRADHRDATDGGLDRGPGVRLANRDHTHRMSSRTQREEGRTFPLGTVARDGAHRQ